MSESTDTRTRLINATLDIILTRGEAAVRVTEVAEAAGIKQPSMYYFFKNRDELIESSYRELYMRTVADTVGMFERELSSANSREEAIAGATRALEFAFSNDRFEVRVLRLGLLNRALTNEALLREVNDASYESHLQLAAQFARVQREGWIRNDVSPLTLALWSRSMVFGRLILEVDVDRYDGDEWNRIAIESLIAGFLPR